jgi:hypothetical protein
MKTNLAGSNWMSSRRPSLKPARFAGLKLPVHELGIAFAHALLLMLFDIGGE